MSNFQKIPKKMFQLITSMMEANVVGHTTSSEGSIMTYDPESELYTGHFDAKVVELLEKKGLLELTHSDDGELAIRINEHSPFLTSFSAGALEHKRGNDIYYADYSSHPFAFVAGYQHSLERKKLKAIPYCYDEGRYCHGFECEDTGEVFTQC